MKTTLKDFIGTVLVFIGIIDFILIIGFAGGVDQNHLTVEQGWIRLSICLGVFIVVCGAVYLLCRNDDRD